MTEQMHELSRILGILLGPDGCPWDKAQTHASLRPHLLEECYEVADAIDQNNMPALKEELGDLLLHVMFHAKLAELEGHFNLTDVVAGINEKLVRRHTHIFGGEKAASPEEAETTWEANKKKENTQASTIDHMRAVPKAMPALMRAEKVQKRAGTTSTLSTSDILSQCQDHLAALQQLSGTETAPQQAIMEIFGNLLLCLTNLSPKMQLNAEIILTNAIEAFITTTEEHSK